MQQLAHDHMSTWWCWPGSPPPSNHQVSSIATMQYMDEDTIRDVVATDRGCICMMIRVRSTEMKIRWLPGPPWLRFQSQLNSPSSVIDVWTIDEYNRPRKSIDYLKKTRAVNQAPPLPSPPRPPRNKHEIDGTHFIDREIITRHSLCSKL